MPADDRKWIFRSIDAGPLMLQGKAIHLKSDRRETSGSHPRGLIINEKTPNNNITFGFANVDCVHPTPESPPENVSFFLDDARNP